MKQMRCLNYTKTPDHVCAEPHTLLRPLPVATARKGAVCANKECDANESVVLGKIKQMRCLNYDKTPDHVC
jgi:hypothetical protein